MENPIIRSIHRVLSKFGLLFQKIILSVLSVNLIKKGF